MQDNSTKIRKGRYQTKFTTLPNETLQSENITPEALGVLCRLCSLPEDWFVSKEWLQKKTKGCGRDKLTRIFKELQELGFIVKHLVRGAGGKILSTEWHVFPEPQAELIKEYTERLETRQAVETEQLETRPTENPDDGKPATTKEIDLQNKDLTNTTTTTTREREFFDFKDWLDYTNGSATVPVPPRWAYDIYCNIFGYCYLSDSMLRKNFGDFITYNIYKHPNGVELVQAQAMFNRWLSSGKVKTPNQARKSEGLPAAPGPRKERQQATPPAQPAPSVLTPVEITWLKQGNIPVGLRERLGDEKYIEVLKKYGLENEQ